MLIFGGVAGWKMDPLIESMYFLLKMGIFQPASCDRLPEGTHRENCGTLGMGAP